MTLFYLHWHKEELEERVAPLLSAGYSVSYHWSTEETAKLEELPDIFIISLDRLPSHGRSYAEWLWEAKKRRHIPIIFAGGMFDKVETARKQFPRAVFCETPEVVTVIAKLVVTAS